MKTESNVMPVAPYDIEFNGDTADLIFYDNIVEGTRTDESGESTMTYTFDIYRVTVPNRAGLETTIDNNVNAWLAAAKGAEYEKLAKQIREKRDRLLAESDSEMCLDRMGLNIPDSPSLKDITEVIKGLASAIGGSWARYRQALRDIPEQAGFPYEVEFPRKPE